MATCTPWRMAAFPGDGVAILPSGVPPGPVTETVGCRPIVASVHRQHLSGIEVDGETVSVSGVGDGGVAGVGDCRSTTERLDGDQRHGQRLCPDVHRDRDREAAALTPSPD